VSSPAATRAPANTVAATRVAAWAKSLLSSASTTGSALLMAAGTAGSSGSSKAIFESSAC